MSNLIKNRKRGDEGFSLIELLVVVVILGILAAIVVFAVSGLGDRGQSSACDAERQTIRTAQEAYYAKSTPPAYAESATALVTAGLLSSAPKWHTTAKSGTSFSVTPIANSACA